MTFSQNYTKEVQRVTEKDKKYNLADIYPEADFLWYPGAVRGGYADIRSL